MDIFFLVSSLNFGGAERVATTLCNSWVETGHNVTLIATYNGLEQSYFKISPKIKLIYLANDLDCIKGRDRSSLGRLSKLRHLLKNNRPEVVVSFLPSSNLMAIIAGFKLNIPIIICERTDPEFYPQPWIWKIACRYLYRLADILTVQTENVANKAERLFHIPKNLQVVPNPLPFPAELSVDTALSKSKVLISVGRLIESKQVDHLVHAFLSVHQEYPDWQLHIYGDGPEKSRLIHLVSDYCADAFIKVLGDTSSPWDIMKNAECFAMTSRFEGFPNALLEALAFGLPTVVYDCPSGPDEITNRGEIALLVPLNNLAEFTQALRSILADRELREHLHVRAKKSIVERYALDVVLAKWQTILVTATENRRTKGRHNG
jgi:glycosyltransferase involved in cell wall biosynthesis